MKLWGFGFDHCPFLNQWMVKIRRTNSVSFGMSKSLGLLLLVLNFGLLKLCLAVLTNSVNINCGLSQWQGQWQWAALADVNSQQIQVLLSYFTYFQSCIPDSPSTSIVIFGTHSIIILLQYPEEYWTWSAGLLFHAKYKNHIVQQLAWPYSSAPCVLRLRVFKTQFWRLWVSSCTTTDVHAMLQRLANQDRPTISADLR